MMQAMNSPSRVTRKTIEASPSKQSSSTMQIASPKPADTVTEAPPAELTTTTTATITNPIASIIDGSEITVAAVRLYCQGPAAEVALILDNGAVEQPEPTGTFHVGQHWGELPKRMTLPCEGLVVTPTPLNEQDPSWGDEFSATVEGDQLFVARTDGGGTVWGQELEFAWTRRPSVELVIGPHVGPGPKEVTLPTGLPIADYEISGTPVNEQQEGWTDTFSASVVEGKLTVWRTDSEDSNTWGQPLVIRAYKRV